MKAKENASHTLLTVVIGIVALLFLMPVLIVLMNSFKANTSINTATFAFPNGDTFVGLGNYITGMTFGNYPFYQSALYSILITVVSVLLILVCNSMAAWYLTRVGDAFSKLVYYLCLFSMIVPFQMVMFTLASTARNLHLDTPFTIPVIYLGFGSGLATFMFAGFVKGVPLAVEEAAVIDGCGPIATFFMVVFPMLKPILVSVGILELMWVWNDYLLPYLVLDNTLYRTIPIHIQYLQGSYGHVDMGATMALIILSLIPIIAFYMAAQKYIIAGVTAGAVKG